MKGTRTLVSLLLIVSVILGYSETPSLRNAVGVVTSYSTITSTTYTHEFTTWISVSHVSTTLTALAQAEMDGPYVEIKGTFSYSYYADGEHIADMVADSKIKNLMATTITKGMIRLELASLTGPATEEVLVPFWEIKPGETVAVKQGVQITKDFYRGKVKMYFLKAEITCSGITTMTPVATYTYSRTQTRTIITTYTTVNIQQEPLPMPQTTTGIGDNLWLWILPIAAIAAIAALFLLKRRGTSIKP